MSTTDSKFELNGWLFKWANYFKGYQKRWFVLQNGYLSYYRNQEEMGHTCRGTISLVHAKIDSSNSLSFCVKDSNSRTYHLKASTEIERKQWIQTLTNAKANILKLNQAVAEEDNRLETILPESQADFVAALFNKLEELQACERIVFRQCDELLRNLQKTEQEILDKNVIVVESNVAGDENQTDEQNQTTLREQMTMFRVTVNAMMNGLKNFVEFSNGNSRRYERLLMYERQQRVRMERMVEELAMQHRALEKKVKSQSDAQRHSNQVPTTANVTDDEKEMPTTTTNAMISSSPPPHHDDITLTKTTASKATSMLHLPGDAVVEDGDEEDFYDAFEYTCDNNETTGQLTTSSFSVLLPTRETLRKSSTNIVDGVDDDEEEEEETSSSCYSDSSDADFDSQSQEYAANKAENNNNHRHVSETSETEISGRHVVRVITRKCDATSAATTTATASAEQKVKTSAAQTSSNKISSTTSITSVGRSSSSATLVKMPHIRRTSITPRPNYSLNMWSIMKNCIGKELSKIPMPVNFNEPLSFLQRLTEDFEYSNCLDLAAKCDDPIEQMAFVAAFSVSSYNTTLTRTGKPFNPLLGETYECDRRDDLGWRSIAEQVSHHPPAAAIHCESDRWRSWQEFTMSSKFRGKYLSIIPLGIAHLIFEGSQNHFTWRKVTSTVHNIIVGRLWIDNHGEMDIYNHTTGDTCHLTYKSYSYFSRDEPRRVMGVIYDKDKNPKYMLKGTWDRHLDGARITRIHNNNWETGPWTTLWSKFPVPPNADKMYNFTLLAMQLNEMEEGIAPTDSRLRPDQRLMEVGQWDEANKEKERLEDKQRAKRRRQEQENPGEEYNPIWFKSEADSQAGKPVFVYKGKYWEAKEKQNWSVCPDIF